MGMKLGNAGINLIKKSEGCDLNAYRDAVGVLTIGYGHTGNVKIGQKIKQEQADELLRNDVKKFEDGVNNLLKVTINQNQFDALVSFAYNLGLGNLKNSDLLAYVNKKDFVNAAKEFSLWVHAGDKVLNGLVKRRAAEQELFNTPMKSSPAKSAADKSDTNEYHIVVKGDTVSKIAKANDVTIEMIKKWNKLDDEYTIRIGQKLRVE